MIARIFVPGGKFGQKLTSKRSLVEVNQTGVVGCRLLEPHGDGRTVKELFRRHAADGPSREQLWVPCAGDPNAGELIGPALGNGPDDEFQVEPVSGKLPRQFVE